MKRKSVSIAVLANLLLLSGLFLLAGCGGGGGTPQKPGAFDLISPGNDEIASPNPTLSWTAASGAANYTIEIATDPTFSTTVHSETVASALTSRLVSGPALTAGQYSWRVTAVNSAGTTFPNTPYYTFTVAENGGLQWMKNSNPVSGQDAQAFALAIDSSSMYVVGYDYGAGGDDQWRIEKRSLSTGELDPSFGSWQSHAGFVTSQSSPTSFEDVFSIATDTTRGYMYLVGYESDASGDERWRIEKRSLSDGQVDTNFGTNGIISEDTGTGGWNEAQAVALDSSSLYVAGYDAMGQNGTDQWRIEKRDLITGELVAGFDGDGIISDPSVTSPSGVNAIAVDETHIYAVGYYAATDTEEGWYIEKRDKGTGTNFVTSVTSSLGSAKAIAIDDTYMYIAGYDPASTSANTNWRIEKRWLSDLSLVAEFNLANTPGYITSIPTDGSDVPNTVAVDDAYIYVAGYDSNTTDLVKEQWRIEKYDKISGASATTFGADGAVSSNPSGNSDEVWGMALDASSIYLVGYDSNTPSSNMQWRIEKRSK